jgi:glycosyltransferase involved in cell wall biosynthesis
VRDIAMLWLARRFGVKGIIHYRIGTLPATIARNGFAWGLTRTAMRTAAVVLPLGERTVQHVLAELPDLRCLSIPNPIALATVDHMLAALPSAQAEVPALRVVYVGHVTPAKGIRELVGACLRIADSRLTLDLVGVILPKFREEMERLAAERDGGRWLRLHGEVDRMAAVGQMARADILVLPSLTEAFPNVLLEAMACGRPIIATTVGAIEEMLDWDAPQPCGVCVPPGDEGALREAIEQLASDPERRAELGRRAREKAERCYALDVVFPQYVRLWRP